MSVLRNPYDAERKARANLSDVDDLAAVLYHQIAAKSEVFRCFNVRHVKPDECIKEVEGDTYFVPASMPSEGDSILQPGSAITASFGDSRKERHVSADRYKIPIGKVKAPPGSTATEDQPGAILGLVLSMAGRLAAHLDARAWEILEASDVGGLQGDDDDGMVCFGDRWWLPNPAVSPSPCEMVVIDDARAMLHLSRNGNDPGCLWAIASLQFGMIVMPVPCLPAA